MEFRHEWKIEIDRGDLTVLRQRLQAVAQRDLYAADGVYRVRSLYFDTPTDRALREKLDGVDRREKFRIRLYNADTSLIRLEKKSKQGGLCGKQSAALTAAQTQAIVDGNPDWMAGEQGLIRELYVKMQTGGLQPRTIVDYVREPFVYGPGNVRVTLDYDLRTGLDSTQVLDFDRPTVPVVGAPVVLEVKWDAFLPDVIRDAVQLRGRRAGAFSKYAACRMYG